MTRPEWSVLRDQLAQRVEASPLSPAAIADQIGISRPQLLNLTSGATKEPREETQDAVFRWLSGELPGVQHRETMGWMSRASFTGGSKNYSRREREERKKPEEELLEYFVQNHEHMAIFMSTTTEGLSPTDRRKVALAILNGFKKLAIQAGEPIPQVLYDIERRFVADTE